MRRHSTADGYFRTGDIGVFDDKGFLKIVDRKKDMIIVSGFKRLPERKSEAVAAGLPPGVAECACVGKSDEKTGEGREAVRGQGGGAPRLTEDDVIRALPAEAHCLQGARRKVRFLDALPKSKRGQDPAQGISALSREMRRRAPCQSPTTP